MNLSICNKYGYEILLNHFSQNSFYSSCQRSSNLMSYKSQIFLKEWICLYFEIRSVSRHLHRRRQVRKSNFFLPVGAWVFLALSGRGRKIFKSFLTLAATLPLGLNHYLTYLLLCLHVQTSFLHLEMWRCIVSEIVSVLLVCTLSIVFRVARSSECTGKIPIFSFFSDCFPTFRILPNFEVFPNFSELLYFSKFLFDCRVYDDY